MNISTRIASALAVIILTGCASAQTQLIRVPAGELFAVGRLVANQPLGLSNPSEYVLEDGRLYRGLPWRANGVNLRIGPGSLPPAGSLVLYRYTAQPSLADILVDVGQAPEGYGARESMQQLRSDWMAPETGFSVGRSTRAVMKRTAWHDVSWIQPFDAIRVERGKDIRITLSNPTDTVMSGIEIAAHYEGGRGKPWPRYERKTIERLAPGERQTLVWPLSLTNDERGGNHTYVSLIVKKTLGSRSLSFEY